MTFKLRARVNFPANVTGDGGIQVVKENGEWTISPDFAALTSIPASSVSDPTTQEIWIYNPVSNSYAVLTLAGLGDALFKLTSTTSLSIGTGSKAFTTQTGKDIGVGQYVLAVDDANPATNFMFGQVTAYSSGVLTVNVTSTGGSGTYADWTIRPAGSPGPQGPTGPSGAIGGSTGATDNRVLRSDGTGGTTLQNSAVTIDDSGNISGAGTVDIGNADTTLSRASAGVIAVEGVNLTPNIPITSKSAAYTTVLADANTAIYHPSSDNNARTFTIDSNANVAYPVGTCLTFINDINTVTIAITSDTLVFAGPGSTGSRTLAANGMATAVKVASTRWVISGAGLS